MSIGKTAGRFAVEHTRMIAVAMVGITLVLAVLAALPSIWPHRFAPLNSLKIDTDPENMLPTHEPVRVFHDRMKEIMSLNDMIVVGIVNEKNEAYGVFNPDSLKRIYALTEFVRGLRWRNPDEPSRREGVVEVDIIAPSMVDNVQSGGAGVVQFEWLMPQPPTTQEQALAIQRKALDLPFLRGTLVSEDGKAIALYLPITSKDISYRISNTIKQKLQNPSRLFPSEIGNLNDVLNKLIAARRDQGDGLIRRLWQVLSVETQQQLIQAEQHIDQWRQVISRREAASDNEEATDVLKDKARRLLQQRQSALEAFVGDLNAWMGQSASAPWRQPDEKMRNRLGSEGRQLLEGNDADLQAEQTFRLKRLWVEAALPKDIIPSRVATMKGDEAYHITGLPVAEDTFGVQMFKQMAISAPLAMLVIFLLMWFFFRSPFV